MNMPVDWTWVVALHGFGMTHDRSRGRARRDRRLSRLSIDARRRSSGCRSAVSIAALCGASIGLSCVVARGDTDRTLPQRGSPGWVRLAAKTRFPCL